MEDDEVMVTASPPNGKPNTGFSDRASIAFKNELAWILRDGPAMRAAIDDLSSVR
jgi:hypothetical protein